MIPYNLKEDKYKNHPKDGLYGVILKAGAYTGYPVTIVDNSEEVKDNKSTRLPALVLIHLSEGVRQYSRMRLYDEFLYLGFSGKEPTYRMYDYTKKEMTQDEIIQTLKKVFYDIQPQLQSRTMMGWTSGELEDDPNRYNGSFILNNEEEYKIKKCGKTVYFYKGTAFDSPSEGEEEVLLCKEEINFDIYKQAIEVSKLRGSIVMYTNHMLDDTGNNKIEQYYQARKELDKKLKTL
jgi:hypothetical protein